MDQPVGLLDPIQHPQTGYMIQKNLQGLARGSCVCDIEAGVSS